MPQIYGRNSTAINARHKYRTTATRPPRPIVPLQASVTTRTNITVTCYSLGKPAVSVTNPNQHVKLVSRSASRTREDTAEAAGVVSLVEVIDNRLAVNHPELAASGRVQVNQGLTREEIIKIGVRSCGSCGHYSVYVVGLILWIKLSGAAPHDMLWISGYSRPDIKRI